MTWNPKTPKGAAAIGFWLALNNVEPDDDFGEPLFPIVRALEAMLETRCTILATV